MKSPSVRVVADAGRIAEPCARRGWTWSQFAKELGMSEATRSKVRNGRPVRVSTLHRIADKLGVRYSTVLFGVATIREGVGGEAGGAVTAAGIG